MYCWNRRAASSCGLKVPRASKEEEATTTATLTAAADAKLQMCACFVQSDLGARRHTARQLRHSGLYLGGSSVIADVVIASVLPVLLSDLRGLDVVFRPFVSIAMA
jgi:hypothetical protein